MDTITGDRGHVQANSPYILLSLTNSRVLYHLMATAKLSVLPYSLTKDNFEPVTKNAILFSSMITEKHS